MIEFWQAIAAPGNGFLRLALLAGLLASIASGVVGSYVVSRRITYLAGGIAHCVLGGVGIAGYLQVTLGWEWLHPLHGALAAALLGACVMGGISIWAKEREDTVISAIWVIGMATGILFISVTPGYAVDPMSYLFGDILLVSQGDIKLIAGLNVAILLITVAFYKQLLAVCFDEEFARLRGVKVRRFYLLLLIMTALTVVSLVLVVGIVLAIALLALPAATAGHFSKTLWQMMGIAVLLSAVVTTMGLSLSYAPDLPSGPMIVLLSGAVYLVVSIFTHLRKKRQGG